MRKLLPCAVLLASLDCGPKPPNPIGPSPIPTAAAQKPLADPTAIDLTNVGVPLPDDSVCEKLPDGTFKDPVPPGKYKGILRNAKCDQQRFLTMGYLSQKLGINGKCNYCHATDPSDPNKVIYGQPTEKKKIANWMLWTFIDGMRRNDGQKMTCVGCHNDGKGNGTPKILHAPRDNAYAQEWMNGVMTSQFATHGGGRLRCKTCHVGMAPAQEGWNPSVILQLEAKDGALLRLAAAPPVAPPPSRVEVSRPG